MRVINLEEYELSGGGRLGESFFHKSNPNVLLKLYTPQLEQTVLEEYDRACKVFASGIPSPEPGEAVRANDGRIGILFKRIVGKKSYARALSEHPERLEEYAASFAQVCKQLHSTKPASGLFPTAKEKYAKEIGLNPFLTEEEKAGLFRYIDQLPDAETAVHGDLHHGNVIFTDDGQQYFIDLSDYCTGSPLFDLGIILLQTCMVPEEIEKELYHIDLATSRAFWRAFVTAYFGPETSVEEVEALVRPYAFLRILVVEHLTGRPIKHIRPAVHDMIGM